MQKPGQKFDEFTDEQLRQLEARKWSDLLADMAELKADLAAHRVEVQEIRQIFTQAQGALVLIRWGALLVGAVAGAAVWASQHLTWKG